MAEINGLLNRRTTLKLYRGFESLPHRAETVAYAAVSYLINEWLLNFDSNETQMADAIFLRLIQSRSTLTRNGVIGNK